MEFSGRDYWSELPFPSPGDLPDLGVESGSPALQADALPSEPPGKLNNVTAMLQSIPDPGLQNQEETFNFKLLQYEPLEIMCLNQF